MDAASDVDRGGLSLVGVPPSGRCGVWQEFSTPCPGVSIIATGRRILDDKPRAWALRRGRYSEAGQVYLVTAVTRQRIPVFRDFFAARTLVQALRLEQAERRAQTLAYVVMPDHLHWLLQLGEGRTLSAVVGAVKSVTAHRVGTPIWQPGFHDHAMRREEDVRRAARYLVANPLRAGLVIRAGDYPHWDVAWI